jgi:hypothetical protein
MPAAPSRTSELSTRATAAMSARRSVVISRAPLGRNLRERLRREIRLVAVHGMPGQETMRVSTALSNEAGGNINLAEAQAMVADGSARWIGETPPEALRQPEEPRPAPDRACAGPTCRCG